MMQARFLEVTKKAGSPNSPDSAHLQVVGRENLQTLDEDWGHELISLGRERLRRALIVSSEDAHGRSGLDGVSPYLGGSWKAVGVSVSRLTAVQPRRRSQPGITLILMICGWLCGVLDLAAAGKKVVVLGVDGMDPKLLQTF